MFEDNYQKTQQAIARYILDHVTRGLRHADRENLERFIVDPDTGRLYGFDLRPLSRRQLESGEDPDSNWGDLQCSLYVSMDCQRRGDRDEAGNVWESYRVKAEVNWPSWGSMEPGLAGERVGFMDEVCQLARNIEANFSDPVWQLVETRAEAEAREAARLVRRRDEYVLERVRASAGQMRVGQTRTVEIPAGDTLFDGVGGPRKWEGLLDWRRPRDVWKFRAVVEGRTISFVRVS